MDTGQAAARCALLAPPAGWSGRRGDTVFVVNAGPSPAELLDRVGDARHRVLGTVSGPAPG